MHHCVRQGTYTRPIEGRSEIDLQAAGQSGQRMEHLDSSLLCQMITLDPPHFREALTKPNNNDRVYERWPSIRHCQNSHHCHR